MQPILRINSFRVSSDGTSNLAPASPIMEIIRFAPMRPLYNARFLQTRYHAAHTPPREQNRRKKSWPSYYSASPSDIRCGRRGAYRTPPKASCLASGPRPFPVVQVVAKAPNLPTARKSGRHSPWPVRLREMPPPPQLNRCPLSMIAY